MVDTTQIARFNDMWGVREGGCCSSLPTSIYQKFQWSLRGSVRSNRNFLENPLANERIESAKSLVILGRLHTLKRSKELILFFTILRHGTALQLPHAPTNMVVRMLRKGGGVRSMTQGLLCLSAGVLLLCLSLTRLFFFCHCVTTWLNHSLFVFFF